MSPANPPPTLPLLGPNKRIQNVAIATSPPPDLDAILAFLQRTCAPASASLHGTGGDRHRPTWGRGTEPRQVHSERESTTLASCPSYLPPATSHLLTFPSHLLTCPITPASSPSPLLTCPSPLLTYPITLASCSSHLTLVFGSVSHDRNFCITRDWSIPHSQWVIMESSGMSEKKLFYNRKFNQQHC